MANLVLFIRALFLVMGWLHDQKQQGYGQKEALQKLKEHLDARVDAARAARSDRLQPDKWDRDKPNG